MYSRSKNTEEKCADGGADTTLMLLSLLLHLSQPFPARIVHIYACMTCEPTEAYVLGTSLHHRHQ